MQEVFRENTTRYNLRNNDEFIQARVRSVSNGTESVRIKGPQLWLTFRPMPFRPLFPCVPWSRDQVISANQRTQGNKGRKGISLANVAINSAEFRNPLSI